MVASITPRQLFDLKQAGQPVDVIDVRTPVEFREVHVEFARNVPLDRLDPKGVQEGRGNSTEPLYVVCKSGGRSKQACEKFLAAGFNNVVNVEGGTNACVAANLPVVRGQKAMSLERQVRIAAGSLTTTTVPRIEGEIRIGSSKCAWVQVVIGFSRRAQMLERSPRGAASGGGAGGIQSARGRVSGGDLSRAAIV